MQRLFDIIFSLIALLFLSPLFITIILILKLTGEGEIFFVQKRHGLNQKEIKLLKFVTMVKNSENMGTGTVTLKNDPRILPFGGFLRKTKINELPQIINVLNGSMSVIGPRPQTKRCFNAFPYSSRSVIASVKPGLSGIGSIIFRDEEEMLDETKDPDELYDNVIMPYKADIEMWYTKNNSIILYFALIFLTVYMIIFRAPSIIWKVFPTLPLPPNDLKKYFEK